MMSRKHYKALADVIREQVSVCNNSGEFARVQGIALGVAAVCAADNHRFSRDRFYEACGLPDLRSN